MKLPHNLICALLKRNAASPQQMTNIWTLQMIDSEALWWKYEHTQLGCCMIWNSYTLQKTQSTSCAQSVTNLFLTSPKRCDQTKFWPSHCDVGSLCSFRVRVKGERSQFWLPIILNLFEQPWDLTDMCLCERFHIDCFAQSFRRCFLCSYFQVSAKPMVALFWAL